MKQKILSNWNFMRLFRLGLGILIIIQAINAKEWGLGFMGLLFTLMPVFNIGCCGVSGCATPSSKIKTTTSKDINYEEVV